MPDHTRGTTNTTRDRANLAGICGIRVPCGTVEEEGSHLPVGLQLIGKPMAEADLLKAVHAVEVA